MVDVKIVTTQSDTQNRFRDRSNYVWVDTQIGYYFQAIVGPTSQTMKGVEYYKTINAGDAWTGPTDIWRNIGGTGRETDGYDIWYDRWTPGDTGTIIHVAVSTNITSASQRQHKYFTIDTADDTLTEVHAGFVNYSNSATGRSVSIIKAEDGALYFQTAQDISSTFAHNLWRSTDAGLNWTDLGSVVGIQGVRFVIFPTASTDQRDVLVLVLDLLGDSLKAYVWDDSITAFTSPVTLGAVGDFNHSTKGNFWTSTFRQSDKATLVAIHEEGDHTSHDFRFFQVDWDGTTLTATEKAKIFTAQTHGPAAAVTLNNNNDDIYVAYSEGTSGSTVITQVKSTDGGTTWGAATQMSDEDVDYVSVWGTPQIAGSGRIHPIFERTVSDNDPDGESYQFLANTFILTKQAMGNLVIRAMVAGGFA